MQGEQQPLPVGASISSLSTGSREARSSSSSLTSPSPGLLFGGGFGYAGYLINEDPERGFRFGTTVSALMSASMGYRWYTTRKFMPSGLLAVLGGGSLAYHGMKWNEWASS